MGLPRQQRPARNHRGVTPNAPVIVQQLVPLFGALTAHTVDVTMTVATNAPDTSFVQTNVTLNGIPAFIREADSATPTLAVLLPGENTVQLTFGGAPLTTFDRYFLGARDPAVRTYVGGFIGPGVFGAPDITPVVREYIANYIDDTHTLLTFTGIVGNPIAVPWNWFSPVGGGAGIVGVKFAGATIEIEWTNPVVAGQSVYCALPPLAVGGPQWEAITDAAVLIT